MNEPVPQWIIRFATYFIPWAALIAFAVWWPESGVRRERRRKAWANQNPNPPPATPPKVSQVRPRNRLAQVLAQPNQASIDELHDALGSLLVSRAVGERMAGRIRDELSRRRSAGELKL